MFSNDTSDVELTAPSSLDGSITQFSSVSGKIKPNNDFTAHVTDEWWDG